MIVIPLILAYLVSCFSFYFLFRDQDSHVLINPLGCLEWMEARGVDYVIKTESLISFIALKIWLKLEDLPTTVDYG